MRDTMNEQKSSDRQKLSEKSTTSRWLNIKSSLNRDSANMDVLLSMRFYKYQRMSVRDFIDWLEK